MRQKDHYQNNKQELNRNYKIWRKVNLEKVRASSRAYCKANPDKNRKYVHKSRALKLQTEIEPIDEQIVFIRNGWKCQHCKKKVNKRFKWPHPMCASMDHIIPLSRGGTHTYNNVQLAHLFCNLSKKDNALPQGEQLRIF